MQVCQRLVLCFQAEQIDASGVIDKLVQETSLRSEAFTAHPEWSEGAADAVPLSTLPSPLSAEARRSYRKKRQAFARDSSESGISAAGDCTGDDE